MFPTLIFRVFGLYPGFPWQNKFFFFFVFRFFFVSFLLTFVTGFSGSLLVRRRGNDRGPGLTMVFLPALSHIILRGVPSPSPVLLLLLETTGIAPYTCCARVCACVRVGDDAWLELCPEGFLLLLICPEWSSILFFLRFTGTTFHVIFPFPIIWDPGQYWLFPSRTRTQLNRGKVDGINKTVGKFTQESFIWIGTSKGFIHRQRLIAATLNGSFRFWPDSLIKKN